MGEVAPPANPGVEVSRRKSKNYAMYVFWVMFSINFLNYLDRNVLTGAANVVAHELGFGSDGIGYIASAFLIVYTLGTLPLGVWADRTKRKNVVAACVTVWSLATAFTALASNFITLFISRMVLGIGEAGYFPAGTALMGDYFSRERRSRIMSWWNVGQLVGILFGFAIGGEVAGLFVGSWRLAFVFTGIPGLILAFLAWRLREPRRNEADEEALALASPSANNEIAANQVSHTVAIPSNMFSQFRDLLRIKTLDVLIIMQVFAYFVLGVNVVFLPTFLQQTDIFDLSAGGPSGKLIVVNRQLGTFGLSSGFAGILSGVVIVVAGIAGTIIGGYMADLLNRRHPGARVLVCGIGFLLSAPSFALALILHSFTLFIVFFILTALLVTVYQGPSTAATQDVVPSALRASGVAISLLIAHLFGDALAPSIVGVLAKAFDPTHGQHFLNNVAGQDFSHALLITCTPALVIAGLVGIFGARWMKDDIEAANRADQLARAEEQSYV
jgi:MFS family permease